MAGNANGNGGASRLPRTEIRSENLRTLSMLDERRVGETDYLIVGDCEAADVVGGVETANYRGSLAEHTGHSHATVADRCDLTVHGKLSMHCKSDTTMLAGAMTENFIGPAVVMAGMSDDMVLGGGTRVSAPLDIVAANLIGMEEKLVSLFADLNLTEVAGLMFEREYGMSTHQYGTGMLKGTLWTTEATTFFPLIKTVNSVRNLIKSGEAEKARQAQAKTLDGAGGKPPQPPGGGGMIQAAANAEGLGDAANQANDAANMASAADNLADLEETRSAATQGEQAAQLDDLVGAGKKTEDLDFMDDMKPYAEVGLSDQSAPASGTGNKVDDSASLSRASSEDSIYAVPDLTAKRLKEDVPDVPPKMFDFDDSSSLIDDPGDYVTLREASSPAPSSLGQASSNDSIYPGLDELTMSKNNPPTVSAPTVDPSISANQTDEIGMLGDSELFGAYNVFDDRYDTYNPDGALSGSRIRDVYEEDIAGRPVFYGPFETPEFRSNQAQLGVVAEDYTVSRSAAVLRPDVEITYRDATVNDLLTRSQWHYATDGGDIWTTDADVYAKPMAKVADKDADGKVVGKGKHYPKQKELNDMLILREDNIIKHLNSDGLNNPRIQDRQGYDALKEINTKFGFNDVVSGDMNFLRATDAQGYPLDGGVTARGFFGTVGGEERLAGTSNFADELKLARKQAFVGSAEGVGAADDIGIYDNFFSFGGQVEDLPPELPPRSYGPHPFHFSSKAGDIAGMPVVSPYSTVADTFSSVSDPFGLREHGEVLTRFKNDFLSPGAGDSFDTLDSVDNAIDSAQTPSPYSTVHNAHDGPAKVRQVELPAEEVTPGLPERLFDFDFQADRWNWPYNAREGNTWYGDTMFTRNETKALLDEHLRNRTFWKGATDSADDLTTLGAKVDESSALVDPPPPKVPDADPPKLNTVSDDAVHGQDTADADEATDALDDLDQYLEREADFLDAEEEWRSLADKRAEAHQQVENNIDGLRKRLREALLNFPANRRRKVDADDVDAMITTLGRLISEDENRFYRAWDAYDEDGILDLSRLEKYKSDETAWKKIEGGRKNFDISRERLNLMSDRYQTNLRRWIETRPNDVELPLPPPGMAIAVYGADGKTVVGTKRPKPEDVNLLVDDVLYYLEGIQQGEYTPYRDDLTHIKWFAVGGDGANADEMDREVHAFLREFLVDDADGAARKKFEQAREQASLIEKKKTRQKALERIRREELMYIDHLTEVMRSVREDLANGKNPWARLELRMMDYEVAMNSLDVGEVKHKRHFNRLSFAESELMAAGIADWLEEMGQKYVGVDYKVKIDDVPWNQRAIGFAKYTPTGELHSIRIDQSEKIYQQHGSEWFERTLNLRYDPNDPRIAALQSDEGLDGLKYQGRKRDWGHMFSYDGDGHYEFDEGKNLPWFDDARFNDFVTHVRDGEMYNLRWNPATNTWDVWIDKLAPHVDTGNMADDVFGTGDETIILRDRSIVSVDDSSSSHMAIDDRAARWTPPSVEDEQPVPPPRRKRTTLATPVDNDELSDIRNAVPDPDDATKPVPPPRRKRMNQTPADGFSDGIQKVYGATANSLGGPPPDDLTISDSVRFADTAETIELNAANFNAAGDFDGFESGDLLKANTDMAGYSATTVDQRHVSKSLDSAVAETSLIGMSGADGPRPFVVIEEVEEAAGGVKVSYEGVDFGIFDSRDIAAQIQIADATNKFVQDMFGGADQLTEGIRGGAPGSTALDARYDEVRTFLLAELSHFSGERLADGATADAFEDWARRATLSDIRDAWIKLRDLYVEEGEFGKVAVANAWIDTVERTRMAYANRLLQIVGDSHPNSGMVPAVWNGMEWEYDGKGSAVDPRTKLPENWRNQGSLEWIVWVKNEEGEDVPVAMKGETSVSALWADQIRTQQDTIDKFFRRNRALQLDVTDYDQALYFVRDEHVKGLINQLKMQLPGGQIESNPELIQMWTELENLQSQAAIHQGHPGGAGDLEEMIRAQRNKIVEWYKANGDGIRLKSGVTFEQLTKEYSDTYMEAEEFLAFVRDTSGRGGEFSVQYRFRSDAILRASIDADRGVDPIARIQRQQAFLQTVLDNGGYNDEIAWRIEALDEVQRRVGDAMDRTLLNLKTVNGPDGKLVWQRADRIAFPRPSHATDTEVDAWMVELYNLLKGRMHRFAF